MMLVVAMVVDEAQHPQLPADASWAGVMIILVLGLIFAATAVGTTVRMNLPARDKKSNLNERTSPSDAGS